MTREERLDWLCRLRSGLVWFDVPSKERPVFEQVLSEVIKDLEQEPVLDKIKAEIDKARFVDKDTRICKNALASGLEVALQIIDKYKAESED